MAQHLVLAVAAYLFYRFFYWTKEGLPAGHQINRSWADASMVFLFLTLMVGPLARLWPRCRVLIPWRRDLGLWFAITAVIHIGLLAELRSWNVLRFFVNEEGELLKAASHASNWAGLLALVILLVLAMTSNQFSERLLGGSGWKFLQQQVYGLFLLSCLHTFIFVYQVDGRQSVPFKWVFWGGVLLVALFQVWGFVRTIQVRSLRRSSMNKQV
ncbi:MAG: ferric reductase-like transmembrane domain-containing protein [Verrucomicrobiae bacterium]|nr:ferric reductase-like transmembrane domain-containing protein [Verrucomicrobiae bacterium]